MEVDLTRGGWDVSRGLFQGAGANMPAKGNGPLGVIRMRHGLDTPDAMTIDSARM